jgi:ABC-2 type transport system permease protein
VIRLLSNEWCVLRRDRGLWVLCAAYVVLLGYGCVQSVVRVRALRAQAEAAVDDYERRWAGLRASAAGPAAAWGDWRSPSLVGGPAGFSVTWMPIDGLAALSAGESLRQTLVRRVTIYPGDEEPPLENPLAPAGGLFDLSFIVQWLLPLTIAAAAHGVVSVDRQQGTWRLIAATTSAPARVLAARLCWPMAMATGLTVMAGSIAVLLSGPIPDTGAWGRLLAWAAMVGAYALFWTLVAGSVSARASTPAASLTGACLLWITLTWVAPGTLDAWVTASIPPPNRVVAQVAAREIERGRELRLPVLLEAIYARRPEWRPTAAAVAAASTPVPGGPASRDSRRVYAPALAAAEAAAPLQRAVAERRERTERTIRRWSVVSPALAIQQLADDLAGTSAARFSRFDRHVSEAQDVWLAFFAPRIMRLQEMTRADMDAVPTLAPFRASGSVRDALWPAAGLLGALSAAGLALRGSLRLLRG